MANSNKNIEKESGIYDLPEEMLAFLRSNLEFKKYKKKEVFIRANQHQTNFFFLKSGIARAYTINEKDKIFTRSLYTAPKAIAPIRAIITGEKTNLNFDCLTDCEMFSGSYEAFHNLTKTNLAISNAYSKMLEKALFLFEERVFELTLNATDKYLKLKKRIPEIEDLIPQYQIATYLNITNVQLSRVRKKVLAKEEANFKKE